MKTYTYKKILREKPSFTTTVKALRKHVLIVQVQISVPLDFDSCLHYDLAVSSPVLRISLCNEITTQSHIYNEKLSYICSSSV